MTKSENWWGNWNHLTITEWFWCETLRRVYIVCCSLRLTTICVSIITDTCTRFMCCTIQLMIFTRWRSLSLITVFTNSRTNILFLFFFIFFYFEHYFIYCIIKRFFIFLHVDICGWMNYIEMFYNIFIWFFSSLIFFRFLGLFSCFGPKLERFARHLIIEVNVTIGRGKCITSMW